MATLSIGSKGLVVTSGLRFCVLKKANDPSVRYDFIPFHNFGFCADFPKPVSQKNCDQVPNVCRIVRHLRGRGGGNRETIQTIDPNLYLQQLEQSQRPSRHPDLTFQKQLEEEERIKNQSPKLKEKWPKFADERANKLQTMMIALGKRIKRPDLAQKIRYYPSVSEDPKRCFDFFHRHNDLNLVSGLKEKHRHIGQAFQSLPENWKSVRIKSDTETKQISVVCTLKMQENSSVDQAIQEMKSKIEPLCTSLFLVTTQESPGEKQVKIEKLKGEDYLVETLGIKEFKFGPFASLPTNIENTNRMFNVIKHAAQKDNVVIDFDCNAGIYGLVLGRNCKRVIGLDNAQVHVNNAILNAQMYDIDHDFRKGANAENLSTILQDLQYENCNAVMLLHPQRLTTLPDRILHTILTSNQISKIVLFTSNPQTEAFKHLIMLMKDGHYNLHKCLAFDMLPGLGNLHTVFILRNKVLKK